MTTQDILAATVRSIQALDAAAIDRMADVIAAVRTAGGRLFLLGNGGGQGHASHGCADFRKLCRIESYCVADNASEMTARANDDGWESAYQRWLEGSRVGRYDAVLVVSVGGGSEHPPISSNLVKAAWYARGRSAKVLAIVGRDGGRLAQFAHEVVLVPCDTPEIVTPVTEGVQSVILHALATHPALIVESAKWEGLA